uniref:Aminopeptidase N-like n=1 Tax=Pundamilia nyererei TaxID=303518 RepID=A0A3B4FR55_9CICH
VDGSDLSESCRMSLYPHCIVVATSQMQATYARKSFPCFDEPAMKAVFSVTIIHSRDTVALSNGKEKGSVAVKITTFEPTRKMSTYLLAFIVSDFVPIESNQNDLLIRIWARRKAIDDGQGSYALNVTGPILRFYEHYYNTSYPLSKSDQIALPDFNAGAMENWGLVTYRETALLYDPILSSTGNKERVSTHWFLTQTVSFLKALEIQAHQILAVCFSKGAAVLRMLSEFLTEPVFARGLSSYLNTFAFGNTVYTDLWDHLQQVGIHIPHSVENIMNRWTLQMGYPVVTVDTRTGSVTQKHFLLDPGSTVDRPSQFNYTWYVPIKWMKTGVQQPQYCSAHRLKNKTFPTRLVVSGQDWVLANTNVSGYFRVNYDPDNWDRLLSTVSIINRAQIIDDAFNLARAKIISTTLALRTTKYLSKERDYIPWESALRNLNYYILMFDRNEVYGVLQAYLKKQIQPLFEHFKTITSNWTRVPTGHTDQYNQINAIGIACSAGVEGCRELIKSWYREWMKNPSRNPIHPNLKSTVYCYAIAFGGVAEWDFAWNMFKNATLASEASRLRSALACSKIPWLLNRYLEYTLDPTKIRKQDATSTIQNIARNVVGMPLAWNFVNARWSYIFQQYGKGSFSFSNLVSGITQRFSTEYELQELKRFKEENLSVGFGSATMALEQAIEKTTANIKWVTENKAEVQRWFAQEST